MATSQDEQFEVDFELIGEVEAEDMNDRTPGQKGQGLVVLRVKSGEAFLLKLRLDNKQSAALLKQHKAVLKQDREFERDLRRSR